MRIFSTSKVASASKASRIYVTPGRHPESDPAEWFNPDGTARQFPVQFTYGAAEVPDPLGKWLIAHKWATKHAKLIVPRNEASKRAARIYGANGANA